MMWNEFKLLLLILFNSWTMFIIVYEFCIIFNVKESCIQVNMVAIDLKYLLAILYNSQVLLWL